MDKIALLTISEYAKGSGGIARYSQEQFRNLKKHAGAAFEIKEAIFDNPFASAPYSLEGFRLLHNLTEYPLMPKKTKATSVNSAHEFQILLHPNLSSKPTKEQAAEYQIRQRGMESILDADYIIANSTQTKNEAVELGFERKIFLLWEEGSIADSSQKSSYILRVKRNLTVGYVGEIEAQEEYRISF